MTSVLKRLFPALCFSSALFRKKDPVERRLFCPYSTVPVTQENPRINRGHRSGNEGYNLRPSEPVN